MAKESDFTKFKKKREERKKTVGGKKKDKKAPEYNQMILNAVSDFKSFTIDKAFPGISEVMDSLQNIYMGNQDTVGGKSYNAWSPEPKKIIDSAVNNLMSYNTTPYEQYFKLEVPTFNTQNI